MTHLTALIADDEEAPRAQLRAALQRRWPELTIAAEAVNGVDAWDAFLEHEPDLCLLDIRMPGLTGIEVAERIAGRAQVVFVTAHGDHALAAFDAGAVDYVLKPVDDERLGRALERVQARLAQPPATAEAALQARGADAALQTLLAQLSAQVRRPAPPAVIQAGIGKEVRLIRVDTVVYFESDARYTRVVHEGGEALIRTPLKELLAQLDPERFWQVHRSVIVNHHHIAAALRIDEGTMQLSLHGRPEKLPVSRHFQGRFRGQ
ncbi:LytR/AlgR family response regulator transcription factor [Aquabacterium humicola]|uniref:LytR/AlgR family response regulator transcription factor n=1 Tax=Aquabacterium humicola TaxID=3237377 RepID=UPI002542F87F|nr:LytTR family DNA-binding domain-containing protein [Rubrivivax pictus]